MKKIVKLLCTVGLAASVFAMAGFYSDDNNDDSKI